MKFKRLIESINDSWNINKLEDLISVLNDIYQLKYEITDTVKGVYSHAETYAELGYYVNELGKALMDQAQKISYFEDEEEFESLKSSSKGRRLKESQYLGTSYSKGEELKLIAAKTNKILRDFNDKWQLMKKLHNFEFSKYVEQELAWSADQFASDKGAEKTSEDFGLSVRFHIGKDLECTMSPYGVVFLTKMDGEDSVVDNQLFQDDPDFENLIDAAYSFAKGRLPVFARDYIDWLEDVLILHANKD